MSPFARPRQAARGCFLGWRLVARIVDGDVTEIPEHLLKRSRDRRAALGLGGGEARGREAAAEAAPRRTPATTAAATPAAAAPSGPAGRKAAAAPPAPPPPKPDPPYVAAAKSRREDPVLGDGRAVA